MRVDATSYDKTIKQIFEWVKVSVAKYICVSNVHMCMETYDNRYFRDVVNGADMVVPDGRPLVWALKLLGIKHSTQVRGSDLLLALCREMQGKNISIGLYGGCPDSLRDFLKIFLVKSFLLSMLFVLFLRRSGR
jgi:Teichoic acid biosynthesis proteins